MINTVALESSGVGFHILYISLHENISILRIESWLSRTKENQYTFQYKLVPFACY